MANRFQKFLYFLSAFSPVLIVFAVVWLLQKSTWNKPLLLSWRIPLVLVLIAVALIVIFSLFFNKASRDLSVLQITAADFKSGDGWLVTYVISYLLPLTSFQFGDVAWIVVEIVIVALLLVLTFSDYVTPHPLLFCRGYHFYEVDVEGAASEYKVISKKQIRNAKEIRKASRVFEFLLIRKG